jgi:RimJ/RimL family protein N-acetyltransferase
VNSSWRANASGYWSLAAIEARPFLRVVAVCILAAVDLESLQIETPRLLLRVPRVEDLAEWAAMMADEEAAKFIGGKAAPEATWRGMMTVIGAWYATGVGMFSVIEKSTGRWVGRLGPWKPLGWPGPEIGWAISRDRWGLGYATEGAAAATDWAFDNLGWTDVIHSIAPNNLASQAVARKLGSRNRGPGRLPPPFEDAAVDIWGQSRDEWRSRRNG